jgi:sec-independent protein translocase protein TatC
MTRNNKPINDFSFWDHADELRSRLIKIIIFFIFLSFSSYFFTDNILSALVNPAGKLIFTSVTDAFEIRVSLAMWVGFFLSLPVIFYHLGQFIALGLKKHERKYVLLFSIISVGLFVAGGLFAYFVLIPFGVKFFLSFSSEYLVPMLSVKNYLSFIGTLILACGIIFELPMVILLLAKIGIVTPQFLSEKRKEAVVIILMISAVITPQTDIATQVMMAIPLIVLYEISVIGARYIIRR